MDNFHLSLPTTLPKIQSTHARHSLPPPPVVPFAPLPVCKTHLSGTVPPWGLWSGAWDLKIPYSGCKSSGNSVFIWSMVPPGCFIASCLLPQTPISLFFSPKKLHNQSSQFWTKQTQKESNLGWNSASAKINDRIPRLQGVWCFILRTYWACEL